MGLDTSHDCWSGPYSAFSRWRNAVATAAGYELVEVGTESEHTYVSADVGDELFTAEHAHGDWAEPPKDILIVLLTHSDAEGRIHPDHAEPLANRLAELLPALAVVRPPPAAGETRTVPLGYEPLMPGQVNFWMAATRRFIAGLRAAAAAREAVWFR